MGDRWDSSLLGNSRYTWYPLSWASGDPEIVYADLWTVDLDAGMSKFLGATMRLLTYYIQVLTLC